MSRVETDAWKFWVEELKRACFLVDTDVWSAARRGDGGTGEHGIGAATAAWWRDVPHHRKLLSWCVLEEMLFGIELVGRGEGRSALAHADDLREWLQDLRCMHTLIPQSLTIQGECARLRSDPRLRNFWTTDKRRKLPKSGGDIHLAATARVEGYPIASNNRADFMAIHEVAPLPGLYVPRDRAWAVSWEFGQFSRVG